MPETLAETAASGDRLSTLRALRDRLAREIDTCDTPRDVAVLSGRLSDVLEQISTLEPPRTLGKVDEITARRETRRAVK